MRSKASKRSLSTAPVSAGESDEDGRSKKKVRWDPKSDDEEVRTTVTASDDFEGTSEERSMTSDNEKVRLFFISSCIATWISRSRNPVHRSALRLVVKGRHCIHV